MQMNSRFYPGVLEHRLFQDVYWVYIPVLEIGIVWHWLMETFLMPNMVSFGVASWLVQNNTTQHHAWHQTALPKCPQCHIMPFSTAGSKTPARSFCVSQWCVFVGQCHNPAVVKLISCLKGSPRDHIFFSKFIKLRSDFSLLRIFMWSCCRV